MPRNVGKLRDADMLESYTRFQGSRQSLKEEVQVGKKGKGKCSLL